MNRMTHWSGMVAVGLLGAAMAWTPACAQDRKTIDGLVINLGLVPAEVALTAMGHSHAHPSHPPPGSEHLLVTVDDQKTGSRIGNADVAVEVTEPHGRVERKTLLHTQAAGFPDYSELFMFGSSGKYAIRVIVTPQPNATPVEARFVVNHVV